MTEHLPVLPIVLPLVAAPVCLLLRSRLLVLTFSLAVTWNVFALAVVLLLEVLHRGVVTYELGGWAAPWGIEYRVDLLSAFVVFFVSAIGAVVLSFAPSSLAREVPADRHFLVYTAYLLCLTGLQGIAITGDLFNLFVFLEISALSAYALVSMGPSRQALTSAFRYLVLGTIGATFILIGIGLMYMMTGTLNMIDMAARLAKLGMPRTELVAAAFLTVGIALKMALFPLHAWLPNAYAYAPSAVTAFLAATATKVSVYVLIRFLFTVFGEVFLVDTGAIDVVLLLMSVVAIFVCSTVAIFQRNIKRMLAYSSLAQIGYMVLGVSLLSVTGLTAGIVHLFNHALTKGGLFLAMGCIAARLGSVDLQDMRGLGRRMPVTMFLWVVGGLGLIGVPLTAGFVSKWYLIGAALEKGWWPLAFLVLLSSLLALVYVWRVVEVAYFQRPDAGDEAPPVEEAPAAMLVPTCLLIGATVFFGLDTTLSADVARAAAETLVGVVR
ncbi:MAG: monovalent cation/H+ antiporter subunit D family protein [Planctomycetota bacterium]|jgi:multicomponent Na+:H+ antiporter subunit D